MEEEEEENESCMDRPPSNLPIGMGNQGWAFWDAIFFFFLPFGIPGSRPAPGRRTSRDFFFLRGTTRGDMRNLAWTIKTDRSGQGRQLWFQKTVLQVSMIASNGYESALPFL